MNLLIEWIWVLVTLYGVVRGIQLWRRTDRQVRVAEAWLDEAQETGRGAVDAQSAVITSKDRRRRNFLGLVIALGLCFVVAVVSAFHVGTPELRRDILRLLLTGVPIVLVISAELSVRDGDRAHALHRRAVDRERAARASTAATTSTRLDDADAKMNALVDTADRIRQTGDAVHVLVNSAMAAQLKTNAILARRLARLTGDPDDAEVAEQAERLYAEHEAAQAGIDATGAAP